MGAFLIDFFLQPAGLTLTLFISPLSFSIIRVEFIAGDHQRCFLLLRVKLSLNFMEFFTF